MEGVNGYFGVRVKDLCDMLRTFPIHVKGLT